MISQIHQMPQCYSSGSDLWVLPLDPESHWFKRINWYSSSQLSFWMYKKDPEFSTSLNNIIKKEQLPFHPIKTHHFKDILVDTNNVFPNKAVLAIDISQGSTEWLKKLRPKAEALQISTIRIFWGEEQLLSLLENLESFKDEFKTLNIEVVSCDPLPL